MDNLSKYKKYKTKYINLKAITKYGGELKNMTDEQVTVLRQFVIMPGHEDSIHAQLINLTELIRKEFGNINHNFFQLKNIPTAYYTLESWKNQQALDAYVTNSFNRLMEEIRPNLVANPMVTRARMLSLSDKNSRKSFPVKNSSSQITLVPFFVIKSGKVEEVRQSHLSMVEPTRAEPGCIDYDLYQSIDDPSVMFFYENWVDQQSLSNHMNTPNFYRVVRGEIDNNLVIPWTALSMTMMS